ncbi:MAG: HAD-IA family hydrolase [Deltaproteobacteria bacterium]|nr:HAD-IA family hydrolase [Deltaproteobacteria bacterium]MBM4324350.1 HAD-IA family hydrolase [Deltaproteobacteria bacterium]
MNSQAQNRKIRCVIYDCDGVLFDSFEANTRLYNDLCAKVGRDLLKEEEKEYVHSHTVYEAIHFIFGKGDDLEKKAIEALKQIDLRNYIVYLKMEPHLFEALNRLKGYGIQRAINTNRTTSMKHIMDRFDLWPFFDMVVTALDVKHPKPHPESIEKILQNFNLNKREVVFIGDSEVDQQTARSSGVPFIAYKNGPLEADFHIEDHLGVFNFLQTFN